MVREIGRGRREGRRRRDDAGGEKVVDKRRRSSSEKMKKTSRSRDDKVTGLVTAMSADAASLATKALEAVAGSTPRANKNAGGSNPFAAVSRGRARTRPRPSSSWRAPRTSSSSAT